MAKAVTREIPDSFDRAIVSSRGRPPDVVLARKQHHNYLQALKAAGYTVEVLAGDIKHPDCVFVEDTAVIVGSVAVATRPGAKSRRGEVGPVAAHLRSTMPVVFVEGPGTVDGGDVMTMGDTLYVGASSRTNPAGIEQLRSVADSQDLTLTVVPVLDVLHLKSAVLPVDDHSVVVTPGTVDETLLMGLTVIHVAEEERHRFSALPLRSGELLVTDTAPQTMRRLTGLGLAVTPIDVSEIQAADGGLTCLSILID